MGENMDLQTKICISKQGYKVRHGLKIYQTRDSADFVRYISKLLDEDDFIDIIHILFQSNYDKEGLREYITKCLQRKI